MRSRRMSSLMSKVDFCAIQAKLAFVICVSLSLAPFRFIVFGRCKLLEHQC